MATKNTKLKAGSPGKQAAVQADTQGEADPDILQAIATLEESEAFHVEQEDGDGKESSGSGILDTIRQQSKETPVNAPESTPAASEDPGEGEDSGNDETPSDRLPEIKIDDIPASDAIKGKFKLFKERTTLLEKRLAEAEEAAKKAAESAQLTEASKALREENEKLLERIEAISLEESPRFRKKFDQPVLAAFKKASPYLNAIPDKEERNRIAALLDKAASAKPGEDNDPLFHSMVSEVIEDESVPNHVRIPLFTVMTGLRDAVNARDAALSDWKKTRTEVDSEFDGAREADAEAATGILRQIGAAYEVDAVDRIKVYRNPESAAIFGYDEAVTPLRKELEEEVKRTALAGKPTKRLLELAHRGTELEFQVRMNAMMAGGLQKLKAKLDAQAKLLEKFNITGTGGGKSGQPGTSAAPGKTPDKFHRGSGILDTMLEVQNSSK